MEVRMTKLHLLIFMIWTGIFFKPFSIGGDENITNVTTLPSKFLPYYTVT